MSDEPPSVSKTVRTWLDYIGLAFVLPGIEQILIAGKWERGLCAVGVGGIFLFIGIMGPKLIEFLVGIIIKNPQKNRKPMTLLIVALVGALLAMGSWLVVEKLIVASRQIDSSEKEPEVSPTAASNNPTPTPSNNPTTPTPVPIGTVLGISSRLGPKYPIIQGPNGPEPDIGFSLQPGQTGGIMLLNMSDVHFENTDTGSADVGIVAKDSSNVYFTNTKTNSIPAPSLTPENNTITATNQSGGNNIINTGPGTVNVPAPAREITAAQSAKFRELMKDVPDKGNIYLDGASQGEECGEYANQILSMLMDAGFSGINVSGSRAGEIPTYPPGVTFVVKDPTHPPALAIVTKVAFEQLGIKVTTGYDQSIQDAGQIQIWVGKLP